MNLDFIQDFKISFVKCLFLLKKKKKSGGRNGHKQQETGVMDKLQIKEKG